jgi:lysophospholipase L1-like esterase
MMKIAKKIVDGERVRLAFFGDSVTEGCFAPTDGAEGDEIDQNAAFPNLVRLMIEESYPDARIEIINAGVGGNMSGMGLYRMKADVLDKEPDFCCVNFALNDALTYMITDEKIGAHALGGMLGIMGTEVDNEYLTLIKAFKPKEAYTGAIRRMFEALQAGGIEALLLTPNALNTHISDKTPPHLAMFAGSTAKLQNDGTFDRVVEDVREVARACSVPIADCYAKWKELLDNGADTDTLLANGVNHPTKEMHHLFAEVIYATIFGGNEGT